MGAAAISASGASIAIIAIGAAFAINIGPSAISALIAMTGMSSSMSIA